jgi:hypothetical protein
MMSGTTADAQPGDVDALIGQIGKKTSHRLNALRWTGEGAVNYDRTTATWLIHGEPIGGWDVRTLAGLRQVGAVIIVSDDSSPEESTVELSSIGRALLDRWLD